MKQPFVNATINDRRKGRELSTQTTQPHPLRPTTITSEHSVRGSGALPVRVIPVMAKKEEVSDLDRMKADLMKMMASIEKKPKKISKSKLIGMAMETATEEAPKDYADVLAMLLAKK